MPKVSGLAAKLQQSGIKPVVKRGPLWEGPQSNGLNGGITQSLINSFLCCRERHRINYIEGWSSPDGFNKHLEFGSLWHAAECGYAGHQDWEEPVLAYAKVLSKRYPMARVEIERWYNVVLSQFPIYVKYWEKFKVPYKVEHLLQEQVFCVPYTLPSGRIVYLRGKWDGVDLITELRKTAIYLFETKTKGDIDEEKIQRTLMFDLQTCLYLVSMQSYKNFPKLPIAGVRYNCVRRPLSGGKGTIKQAEPKEVNCPNCGGKGVKGRAKETCEECGGTGRITKPGESAEDFYKRLQQYFKDEPSHWFMRWKSEITQADIERFKVRCLNPLLEELCDWYLWVTEGDPWRKGNKIHFQSPFGLYSALIEQGATDMDECVMSNSTVGLVRRDSLFDELKESE